MTRGQVQGRGAQSVPETPSPWTLTESGWELQTPLRFNHLLKDSQNSLETLSLIVIIYSWERIQIGSARGGDMWGGVRETHRRDRGVRKGV